MCIEEIREENRQENRSSEEDSSENEQGRQAILVQEAEELPKGEIKEQDHHKNDFNESTGHFCLSNTVRNPLAKLDHSV